MKELTQLFSLLFVFSPILLLCQTAVDTSIYTYAENAPQYPGGNDSLLYDVYSKIIYPKICIDSGIEGKVILRFVVNTDGSITNPKISRTPHPLLGDAALDALNGIKKFKPGMSQGKEIRVWYTLPVNFKADVPVRTDTGQTLLETRTPDEWIAATGPKPGEKGPEFPGGDAALFKYIQRNIRYPAFERKNNIQGKVTVKFVVMEDGSITNARIIKGVSEGLDAEAIRIVNSLPKFIPAIQNEKAVRVYFTLPVIFKLD